MVLGAGPIAIEMAQAFCRLGSQVTVIQRSAQILSKEDKDLADGVMQVMDGEGVRFLLNATVIRSQDRWETSRSWWWPAKTGEEVTLQADKVLVAQGRSPNIEGLGLTGDRGDP